MVFCKIARGVGRANPRVGICVHISNPDLFDGRGARAFSRPSLPFPWTVSLRKNNSGSLRRLNVFSTESGGKVGVEIRAVIQRGGQPVVLGVVAVAGRRE
jgi:hypothetical protein